MSSHDGDLTGFDEFDPNDISPDTPSPANDEPSTSPSADLPRRSSLGRPGAALAFLVAFVALLALLHTVIGSKATKDQISKPSISGARSGPAPTRESSRRTPRPVTLAGRRTSTSHSSRRAVGALPASEAAGRPPAAASTVVEVASPAPNPSGTPPRARPHVAEGSEGSEFGFER